MPFVNGAQVAFAQIHGIRLVYIPGYFGYGKTLLGMGMYINYFGPRGYKLVTNISCVFSSDLDEVQLDKNGKLKAFVLIDEGGEYLDASKDIKDLLRNPRKMDFVLVIPSYHEPHRSAQKLTITPLWSFRSAGIPYIHYEWRSKVNRTTASFGWFGFQEAFGVYSSNDPACSPVRIRNWLIERNQEYRARFGYDEEDEFYGMEKSGSSEFDDVADGVYGALDETREFIEALPIGRAKRGKRR